MSGFFEHTPDSLREWCVNHGMPRFTAKQIFDWVYAKQVVGPSIDEQSVGESSRTARRSIAN